MVDRGNTTFADSLWETIVEQNSYVAIPNDGNWNVLNAYNLFSRYNHIKLLVQIKYDDVEDSSDNFTKFIIRLTTGSYEGFSVLSSIYNNGWKLQNTTLSIASDIIKIAPDVWQVVCLNSTVSDTGGDINSLYFNSAINSEVIMFGTSYPLNSNLKFIIDKGMSNYTGYRYKCYASKYI